jgi:ribose/xylose/arabinose/galactoside ABC-type transport system permease subunit
MSDVATEVENAPENVRATAPLAGIADALIRSILPLLLALVAGGALVGALGHNPFTFYRDIYSGGIELTAWQDSLMRAATLTPIALGLIVVFRANIWNLGYQGQFLLSAAMVAGLGPKLEPHLPPTLTLIVLFVIAGVTGAAWTLIPAILKAWYQTNEIITTLMMTFIGISLAAILVKGPFQDFTSNVPETTILPLDDMLPTIPGTRTHVGVVIAAVLVLIVHYVTTRTSFGLKLQVLGANPRAAVHVGLDPKRCADRRRGRDRGTRHLGLHARRLQPGLRRRRDPVRVPRAPQRARGRAVHPLLFGALRRRRLRDAQRRSAGRLPARHHRPHAALHGLHRVPRAQP